MAGTQAKTGHRPILLLLLVTAAVMAPALWGKFVYDDIPLLVENPRVHSLADALFEPLWGHEFAYWRPLVGLLLAVSLATGGAVVLHGIAILVHLASVAVAFGLAKKLTKSVSGGIFTATLFALHPVQVESVAWGAAVCEPVLGLFVLCSLQGLVRWRLAGSHGTPWWALTTLALALLAKETAVMALPTLILVDRLLLPSGTRGGKRLYLGLGVVLAVYLLARMWVFGSALAGWDRAEVDPTFVGSRRVTAPIEVLGEFVRLLVLPWPLSPFRVLPIETSAARFFTCALWLLLPLGLAAWAWRTERRVSIFGLGLALLMVLVPALQFHAIGNAPIADRYLYLPVFGFALVFAPLGPSRVHLAAAMVLGIVFAVIDSMQIPVWRTQERLIEHGLHYHPESLNLLTMRGNASLRKYQSRHDAADLRAAHRAFSESIAKSRQPPAKDADCWRGAREDAQLGLAWCELLHQQRQAQPSFRAAIEQFEACTKAPGAPADAWIGLGIAHSSAGELHLAEPALLKAVAMAPWNDRAHYNLGFLYSQTNRRAQAIEQLEITLRLQPGNQGAARLLSQLR